MFLLFFLYLLLIKEFYELFIGATNFNYQGYQSTPVCNAACSFIVLITDYFVFYALTKRNFTRFILQLHSYYVKVGLGDHICEKWGLKARDEVQPWNVDSLDVASCENDMPKLA